MLAGEVTLVIRTSRLVRLFSGSTSAVAYLGSRRLHQRPGTPADVMAGPPAICPLRLPAVAGYEGRTNDIVYCYPEVRTEEPSTVVFFGGDLQDFRELMETHRENRNYLKWNLENTSLLLRNFFPASHVVVVRPARSSCAKLANFMDYVSAEMDPNRMEFKTFSCYDNFVPCNNCGAPDHTPTHYALQHLERLLQNLSLRLRTLPVDRLRATRETSNPEETSGDPSNADTNMSLASSPSASSTSECSTLPSASSPPVASTSPLDAPSESQPVSNDSATATEKPDLWWRENLHLDRTNLSLVGFSKGCVVLNQFIYEFHYLKTLTPDDDTMSRLVSRIKDMYWLDGGHAGVKNTWITSRSLLETLTRLSVNVHIHVTPYQVMDERRPWIRKEEKTFSDLLKRLGAPVERTLHFENQVATLMTHFDVLAYFKRQAPTAQETE